MGLMVLVVLTAAQVGGAFGEATATIESLTETTMVINLEVELEISAQAVVAHLSFEGEPPLALPLLDRGGGVFGIRTELPAKNYVIVFEAIGADDGLSTPFLMSQLGADFTGDQSGASPTGGNGEDGLDAETRRSGWLALALGAASLSVLAFWVLGGRDDNRSDSAQTDEEE